MSKFSDAQLARYRCLDPSAAGLTVFHTRLGLSFLDGLGAVDEPRARRIATDLIDHATAARDGYAARDVLTHSGCRELLTDKQTRELTELVDACALGHGTLPAALLANLTTALANAEDVMIRNMTPTHDQGSREHTPLRSAWSG